MPGNSGVTTVCASAPIEPQRANPKRRSNGQLGGHHASLGYRMHLFSTDWADARRRTTSCRHRSRSRLGDPTSTRMRGDSRLVSQAPRAPPRSPQPASLVAAAARSLLPSRTWIRGMAPRRQATRDSTHANMCESFRAACGRRRPFALPVTADIGRLRKERACLPELSLHVRASTSSRFRRTSCTVRIAIATLPRQDGSPRIIRR
jgi:hypothetical protein